MNLFVFVGNGPVVFIDPTGEINWRKWVIQVAVAIATKCSDGDDGSTDPPSLPPKPPPPIEKPVGPSDPKKGKHPKCGDSFSYSATSGLCSETVTTAAMTAAVGAAFVAADKWLLKVMMKNPNTAVIMMILNVSVQDQGACCPPTEI